MKNILLGICLLINYIVVAQKLGEQAVYIECKNAENPSSCSQTRFSDDITLLLTPKIIAEIKDSSLKDGFPVSASFLSDKNGKIIPKDIQILCKNASLHTAIKNYILNLPPFYPKNPNVQERRSAHLFFFVFLPDIDGKSYHSATILEKSKSLIKEEFAPLDNHATLAGCTDKNDTFPSECFIKEIRKIVTQNYVIPETNLSGMIRMFASFYVNSEGTIVLTKVTGAKKDFIVAMENVFQKLPKVIPGSLKGVPVPQAFTLPVILNIQE